MSPTQPTWRRRRNGEETVGIHAHVPPATRAHANEVARGLGITVGRYLEILIARDVLDDSGKPSWAQADVDLIEIIPMPSTTEAHAA